jgi:hypothetical protein
MTEPIKLGCQQQKVYDYIKTHPGATTHDIQFETWVSSSASLSGDCASWGVGLIGRLPTSFRSPISR